MDDLVKVQDDSDCCWTSLVNLPTELLVIIVLLVDTGYNFDAVCFSKV